MLKLRLQRKGRKRMPIFKIVVAEHTMPVKGKYIEKIGGFIMGRKDETLVMKKDRALHWLSVGAKPSQTVAILLLSQGIKEAEKFIKTRKQMPSKVEQKKKEEAEAMKKAKEEAEKIEAEKPVEDIANEEEKKDEGKADSEVPSEEVEQAGA